MFQESGKADVIYIQLPTKKKDGMETRWVRQGGDLLHMHVSTRPGVATFCNGNHVISRCPVRDVTKLPICGRTPRFCGTQGIPIQFSFL